MVQADDVGGIEEAPIAARDIFQTQYQAGSSGYHEDRDAVEVPHNDWDQSPKQIPVSADVAYAWENSSKGGEQLTVKTLLPLARSVPDLRILMLPNLFDLDLVDLINLVAAYKKLEHLALPTRYGLRA